MPHSKQVLEASNSFYFTDLELKSSEDGEFYIQGIASSINKDYGNDTLTEECLTQMADNINSKNIKIGYDHTELLGGRPTLEAVGRLTEAKVESGKLWVKGILDKTFSHFNEIKTKIQNKFLDGLSIEYQVDPNKTQEDWKGDIRHRVINGLKTLMGVALTPRPMNQDSLFDYYVKHTGISEDKQINAEVKQMPEEEKKEEVKEEEKKEAPKEEVKEEEKKEAPVETKSIDFESLGRKTYQESQQKKQSEEFKSMAQEFFNAEIKKVQEPYINPAAKFEGTKTPFDSELKHWKDIINDDKVDIEMKYQAAAKLHDALLPFGIEQRPSGKSTEFKTAGREFNVAGNAAQTLQVEYKAQLEHDTNKGTVYYVSGAELNDIYDPVIVSHLMDKTTLWGLIKKKNVSNIGADTYGFRAWTGRVAAMDASTTEYNYDEGDTLNGYHAAMLKCQIPFMMYGVTVQVSGLMVAEARGSVGDIFAKEVQRATADLGRGINADLFASETGMTVGGRVLGLKDIANDASPATIYGQTRSGFAGLQGTDEAVTGNISKPQLRKMIRTVEKNGANRSQLIFVCDHIQRDKILGLLDPAQRFAGTSSRAGFEGLPTFDGVPIHADDQCDDDYVYTIPMDSYFAVVLVAPTYEDLAKTDDSKKGFIKTYFAVVCENPNWTYVTTGLTTT